MLPGAEITPSEQAFIDYIFSQTGYDVVEANGYIPAFTPELNLRRENAGEIVREIFP